PTAYATPLLADRPNEPSVVLSRSYVAPIAPKGYQGPAERTNVRSEPAGRQVPQERSAESGAPVPMRTPSGFKVVETRHFVVYSQSAPTEDFLKTIESLHANLVLDLAPF